MKSLWNTDWSSKTAVGGSCSHGTSRRIYSLCHTSIMLDLLNADTLNTLTLARTSVEMIDRFYVKPLTAEMKVDILHSKRRPRKAKPPNVDDEGNEIAPKKKAKSAKLDVNPAT